MPEGSFGTASTFTIRQLTGPGDTLVLQSRALPYRPIEFSGSMRAEFTWYQGNPQATVQISGSQEDETTVHGMWKDIFIGDPDNDAAFFNGAPVSHASDLVRIVDTMRRQGQLVEVTWDVLVRQGIITNFRHRWDRHQDIEWEIHFGWVNQGEQAVSPTFTPIRDLSDAHATWSASLRQLISAAKAPFAPARAFAASFNAAIAQASDIVDQISDAVVNVVGFVYTPLDAARRLVSLYEQVKQDMLNVRDATTLWPYPQIGAFLEEGQTDGTLPQPTNQAPASAAKVGETVLAANFARKNNKQARDMAREAAREQYLFGKQIQPDLIDIFIAKDNQDLRDVSTRYYGTQEEWKQIAAKNHLQSSALTAGQVVFIPSLVTPGGS